ncbi:hypothetical protein TNCT_385661 [Trichonephila clavata]|uniref:Uncharacterized protein n=1 Tax=Trichonephila clavata TaxID=2740835 RepID=A0A8X6KVY1_TRICU|nr:hypothetical protein TNCT_385661 [Trichonephila clavata]
MFNRQKTILRQVAVETKCFFGDSPEKREIRLENFILPGLTAIQLPSASLPLKIVEAKICQTEAGKPNIFRVFPPKSKSFNRNGFQNLYQSIKRL